MTKATFINRFKNHFELCSLYRCYSSKRIYQQPYRKQHVNHEMFYFETLRMRRYNIGVHRVCQIEFTTRF